MVVCTDASKSVVKECGIFIYLFIYIYLFIFFFFKQKTAYEIKECDWSSDVCSSDLLNYKLTVYLCSGTDSEKLEWFKTINIAGEKLTDQELRNAVYAGSWVSDAKRYFSKNGCPAYGIGSD